MVITHKETLTLWHILNILRQSLFKYRMIRLNNAKVIESTQLVKSAFLLTRPTKQWHLSSKLLSTYNRRSTITDRQLIAYYRKTSLNTS